MRLLPLLAVLLLLHGVALADDPALAKADAARAAKLKSKNDYTGAAAAYEAATREDPTLASAWLELGWLYLKMSPQNLDGGEAAERRVLALPVEDNVKAMAEFNLGLIAMERRRFDVAAGHFEASLGLRPGNATATAALANARALPRWTQLVGLDAAKEDLKILPPVDLAGLQLGVVVRRRDVPAEDSPYQVILAAARADDKGALRLVDKSTWDVELMPDSGGIELQVTLSKLQLGAEPVARLEAKIDEWQRKDEEITHVLKLFSVTGDKLHPLLSRPTRRRSDAVDVDASATISVGAGGELIADETSTTTGARKPKTRRLTYRLEKGTLVPSGKSLFDELDER